MTKVQILLLLALTCVGANALADKAPRVPAVVLTDIFWYSSASYKAFVAGVKKYTGNEPIEVRNVGDDLGLHLAATSALILPNVYTSGHPISLKNGEVLRNFVNGGGIIIAVYQRNLNTLNSVFGWSLKKASYGVGMTFKSRTPTGISLTGLPSSLRGINGSRTCASSSLPPGGEAIYEKDGKSAVFTIKVGRGHVVWFGWDWRQAYPYGFEGRDWYKIFTKVLDVALASKPVNPDTVVPSPTPSNIDPNNSNNNPPDKPEPTFDDVF